MCGTSSDWAGVPVNLKDGLDASLYMCPHGGFLFHVYV